MCARAVSQPLSPVIDAICSPTIITAPLDAAQAADLSRTMAALADPVRLRLLSIVASGPEVCSCQLEQPLQKSQPTISYHTKILSQAGLITGERRGRWIWWRANAKRLAELRKVLGG